MDCGTLKNWWYRCEEIADLDHIDQLGYHGLRRKFANDLKVQGVQHDTIRALGGWGDDETMKRVYLQDPHIEVMRDALRHLR